MPKQEFLLWHKINRVGTAEQTMFEHVEAEVCQTTLERHRKLMRT